MEGWKKTGAGCRYCLTEAEPSNGAAQYFQNFRLLLLGHVERADPVKRK